MADRPRIALCAGEASGDLLGAGLMSKLRRRFPEAQFAGIGGPHMCDAGLDAWHDCSELAVMGLTEVLAHLPRLLRLRAGFRRRLMEWQPDVFIGIDAPDFNLPVEAWLKQRGMRTVHYVSPSIWAWRAGRAARMGRSADRVLCLFPMEPPIYAAHGVDARFVGHPLADAMPLQPDREGARAALGIAPAGPLLAMLPGSRMGEIRRLLPVFLAALPIIAARFPDLAVVLPAANAACHREIEEQLARQQIPLKVHVTDGHAGQAMIASDVVLLASGTATLEALLAKRPMVVAYRISPVTYAVVKGLGLLKTDRYSLPNALAGEAVVPELMQHDCTPEKIADAVLAWLSAPGRMAGLVPRFEGIHAQLRRDASAQAADAIIELMEAHA
ncbi:lipid-A-disaccharide synthase [Xanthomonadaceae bacterium JHOS43]|nr:lipid-A-disaccharide synthase [Xanthomonadaceae bacterium JHOS43]